MKLKKVEDASNFTSGFNDYLLLFKPSGVSFCSLKAAIQIATTVRYYGNISYMIFNEGKPSIPFVAKKEGDGMFDKSWLQVDECIKAIEDAADDKNCNLNKVSVAVSVGRNRFGAASNYSVPFIISENGTIHTGLYNEKLAGNNALFWASSAPLVEKAGRVIDPYQLPALSIQLNGTVIDFYKLLKEGNLDKLIERYPAFKYRKIMSVHDINDIRLFPQEEFYELSNGCITSDPAPFLAQRSAPTEEYISVADTKNNKTYDTFRRLRSFFKEDIRLSAEKEEFKPLNVKNASEVGSMVELVKKSKLPVLIRKQPSNGATTMYIILEVRENAYKCARLRDFAIEDDVSKISYEKILNEKTTLIPFVLTKDDSFMLFK